VIDTGALTPEEIVEHIIEAVKEKDAPADQR
jgi:hypothetical protein